MPEYPIRDSIITSLNAQEPWPDNVKLFQPYEVEQILLPDNASCLAVQAFLKICNLPFEVEMRWNAEFMSPSGRIPFIKCGAFVVSELEPIAQFAANKGAAPGGRLPAEGKAELRAYMSLISNVLVNAELYISWLDNDTFNTVTKPRNSSVYPWPLGWLQTRAKRNHVAKRLKALHWHDKTLDQVLADVEQCCNSLSQRLGDKDYFFETPTALDALVYGHIRALLSASGPRAGLMIRPITSSLLRHVLRMTQLTGMKLTPQEDYLMTQAFRLSCRRTPSRSHSTSERSARQRKSRASVRIASDHVAYTQDLFGFKPFACKQILIMTTKEGTLTCQYDSSHTKLGKTELYSFILEIIDDILDKVEEVSIHDFTRNMDDNDFEIIAFPNLETDSKIGSVETRFNELLDPIEETNVDTVSLDDGMEDLIQIINDDSNGIVNDKLVASEVVTVIDSDVQKGCLSAQFDDSSPTELDALVFGHVFTIITTRLPCRRLAETVRKHHSLVALAKRIDEQYFKRP